MLLLAWTFRLLDVVITLLFVLFNNFPEKVPLWVLICQHPQNEHLTIKHRVILIIDTYNYWSIVILIIDTIKSVLYKGIYFFPNLEAFWSNSIEPTLWRSPTYFATLMLSPLERFHCTIWFCLLLPAELIAWIDDWTK